jgi:hypothetical protein
MTTMLRYLHQLSAVLFYALGSAFFLAYVLYRNAIGGMFPVQLLTKGDLVLLACALLYGASSVILSIDETGQSKGLRWMIGIPMLLIFIVFAVFNFWNSISFLGN